MLSERWEKRVFLDGDSGQPRNAAETAGHGDLVLGICMAVPSESGDCFVVCGHLVGRQKLQTALTGS